MSTLPSLPARTDVVVVGGGVTGTSIAYFLTRETDRDVTVIEKDAIAAGSTGNSSAIIRHHYGEKDVYTDMAWWSHEFYREFEDRVGTPIAYRRCPRVTFAREGTADAAYAEAGYEALDERDIPVTRYEPDAFEARFPMLNLDGYDFAVSDETAAYSDATDVASGFARAAREGGATVVTGVEVDGFDVEAGAVAGVHTDDGTVECETVVLAAGPWTARLAAELDVDVPIQPSREQVVILDPSDEFDATYDQVPVTGLPGGDYYVRSDFGSGVLVATHHTGEACDADHYENQPDEEVLLEIDEKIAEFLPELDDAGVRGTYSGVYSNTPDRDFVLDQCGPDGCYVACGFSGHGFKHAPAVGRIMTDLITTGDADLVDAGYFALSRFTDNATGHGRTLDY